MIGSVAERQFEYGPGRHLQAVEPFFVGYGTDGPFQVYYAHGHNRYACTAGIGYTALQPGFIHGLNVLFLRLNPDRNKKSAYEKQDSPCGKLATHAGSHCLKFIHRKGSLHCHCKRNCFRIDGILRFAAP